MENGGLANTKAERRYKKGENPAYRPPAGKRFDGRRETEDRNDRKGVLGV